MNTQRIMMLVSVALLVVVEGSSAPTLERVSPAEGAALISKLQDLQVQLRRGHNPAFSLLSGGVAGSSITKMAPREAFLGAHFENVQSVTQVEQVKPVNLKGYTLGLPYEPGRLWCTVSVRAWEHDGKINSVEMDCGAPPPELPPPPPRK
jgi:hypothetical protein